MVGSAQEAVRILQREIPALRGDACFLAGRGNGYFIWMRPGGDDEWTTIHLEYADGFGNEPRIMRALDRIAKISSIPYERLEEMLHPAGNRRRPLHRKLGPAEVTVFFPPSVTAVRVEVKLGEAGTQAELFIIESLSRADEDAGRCDGLALRNVLQLTRHRNPHYYYIRTKQELKEMIELFRESNCRWLHLSCHGNPQGLELRCGSLSFGSFAGVVGDSLNERRLFISACEVGVPKLARAVFRRSPYCNSIIAPGPEHEPQFVDSAIFWSAFYTRMWTARKNHKMLREEVQEQLTVLAAVFPPQMAHYTWDAENRKVVTVV